MNMKNKNFERKKHPMKVTHIITGLKTGGAEKMLLKICKNRSSNIEYQVISLTTMGTMGEKIASFDVPTFALGLSKNPLSIFRLYKAIKLINAFRPNLVQTWLYHANFIGSFIGILTNKPVFWNIRQAKINTNLNKLPTVLIARACAALSFTPKKILCCTKQGIKEHQRLGYRKDKFVFLPNGFEIPPYITRDRKKIILHVGRYTEIKDHKTFILTANALKEVLPDYEFHMYGDGVDDNNLKLKALIKNPNIKLKGRSDKLDEIYPEAKLLISTSLSEGFSNTIGEAMLHDTPVLATDVGDSKYIVNDNTMIIPTESPELIAKKALATLENTFPPGHFRAKVENRFKIETVVRKYEELYLSFLFHKLKP